ncbi:MAG: DUF7557 family protein [Halobacteriota archaeon]
MHPLPPKKEKKNVQLTTDVTERLDKLGTRGDTYNSLVERLLNAYDDQAALMLEAVESVLYAVLKDVEGLEKETFAGDEKHEWLTWPDLDKETAAEMTNRVLELIQTREGFAGLSVEGQVVAWWAPVDRDELEAWKASRLIPQQTEDEKRTGRDYYT